MELFGDLERAFATAIYPNRVLIAIVGVGLLVLLAVVARRRHWDRPIRRHPRTAAIGLVLLLAVTTPVAWYLGSPLFISTTVDEPPPVAAASPAPSARPPVTAAPSAAPSSQPTAPAPSLSPTPTFAPVERSGTFTGADDFHFGEGTARLIETSPGTFVVRLEEFKVRNGPDLFVYLSPAADGYADDAIELGRLKADRGNQNYELPAGTDASTARSVVIWCKQFAVLFATAPLGE